MSELLKYSSTTTTSKLMDQVRTAIRTKHYSIGTEESYADWIKRHILGIYAFIKPLEPANT